MEYKKKMIYLDGELQVFGYVDHLFDYVGGKILCCYAQLLWTNFDQHSSIGPDEVHWPTAQLGPPPPL